MTPLPTEDELRAAVGPNADYYLERWRGTLAGVPDGTAFNYSAFLLSGLWLLYRKVYGVALKFYALLLLSAASVWVVAPLSRSLAIVSVCAAVVFVVGLCVGLGFHANSWYQVAVFRRIERVRKKCIAPESRHHRALATSGGTGFLGPFAAIVALGSIGIAAPVLFDRWAARSGQEDLVATVRGLRSNQTVSLRGPGPKVGEVVRNEFTMKMTDGKFTVTTGGVTETSKMTMSGDGIDEEEVLAVAGGEVTKSRIKIVRERSTECITFDGQTDSQDDKSPLEGETVEFEKAGAEWKRSLVGKMPTDEQTEDLKFFPPPIPAAEFYPAEPIKPGHTWNPDITKLNRHLGLPMPIQIEGGAWKMTFVRVVTVNGEECAEIAEERDVRAKVKNGKDAGTIEVKVRGTTHRSLKTGVSVESRYAGTMSVGDEDGRGAGGSDHDEWGIGSESQVAAQVSRAKKTSISGGLRPARTDIPCDGRSQRFVVAKRTLV